MTEVYEKQHHAVTRTHESPVSVKETNIKTTEHHTEPDTVCKSNEGETEVKPLSEMNDFNTETQKQNTETDTVGNSNKSEIEVNNVPVTHDLNTKILVKDNTKHVNEEVQSSLKKNILNHYRQKKTQNYIN